MIRTDNEYKETKKQISNYKKLLKDKMHVLEEMDLDKEQVQRALASEIAFISQLEEEVISYNRLCRGDQKELKHYVLLDEIGKLLIALRIFNGLSQSQLAQRLNVDPSQVSRDEKNEYYGITVSRVQKIVDTLEGRIKVEYEPVKKVKGVAYASQGTVTT